MSEASDPAIRLGLELNGKWRLNKLLAVGGSSAVYAAVHRNGHEVALKILTRKKIRDRSAFEIAENEARLANAIRHPGVVAIIDDDVTEDGSAYLVMELLEGETLDARRKRAGGNLPLASGLAFFEQLLAVLAAAHDHGIVHRDLKPDNLFITRKGQLKVLDFGLAAERSERDRAPWFGTPGYMAPEQARGDWPEVDALSDLWAAAATFYTALTGRLVHPATNLADLIRAAAFDDIDLTPLEAMAPPSVFDFFERALAIDKDDRFPSARVMLRALRAIGPLPARLPVVQAPPIPHCHSTTRVFLVEAERGHACSRVACTMCPVCPADVPTMSRLLAQRLHTTQSQRRPNPLALRLAPTSR